MSSAVSNSTEQPSTKKTETRKALDFAKKGQILDDASATLRHRRETLIKQAAEAGISLPKEEIRKMKDEEGRARAKKLYQLLKGRYSTKK